MHAQRCRPGRPPEPSDPSLRASVRDGMAHSVMLGSAEAYFGAFGVFLRATTLQIGLLATLPALVGALLQWVGALWMDRLRGRRRVVVVSALAQAATLLPIAALPFVLGRGPTAAWALVALVCVSFAAVGLVGPIWSSLIGDLVPARVRGRFFGRRGRLTGAASFAAMILVGVVLQLTETRGRAAAGFLAAFLLAFAARLVSAWFLSRHRDPTFRIEPGQRFSFWQFVRRSPRSNFARFVFFYSTMNLGVAVAGPYFALYMLRDLGLSYLEYTGVIAAATATQLATLSWWGALSDRFGNRRILSVCGWGVGLVPLLWLLSAEVPYLVAIQVFSGVVWAGFNLASSNFMFDAVSPPKRARCAACQAMVSGVFVFAGSLAGAALVALLPGRLPIHALGMTPASPLLALMFVSGVLRLAAMAVLLPGFHEVRQVERVSSAALLHRVAHLRPFATFAPLPVLGPGRPAPEARAPARLEPRGPGLGEPSPRPGAAGRRVVGPG